MTPGFTLVRELLTDSAVLSAVWKLTHAETVELAKSLAGLKGKPYCEAAAKWIRERRPELLPSLDSGERGKVEPAKDSGEERQSLIEELGKYPEYPD
jgi:hypothetical protein